MSKQEIINRLMALPNEIFAAESVLIAANEKVQEAKNALAIKEAELLTSGKIDGKNAEQRAAQLKALTEAERQAVAQAESEMPKVRAQLARLQNEFAALRAVAGMMRIDNVA